MEFIVEKSLKDFDFWGGATWFANQLTDDQFDLIESYLESAKCEGEYYTDGEINDIFWHDPESLYPALPIEELCRIILCKDDNAEYNDLVDDFIDNYYRLDRLDYTESDIKEAWQEWLEEETLDKAKEIINGDIGELLTSDQITQDQIDDDAIEEWVDDWLFESKLDISDGEDLFKKALLDAWVKNRDALLNQEAYNKPLERGFWHGNDAWILDASGNTMTILVGGYSESEAKEVLNLIQTEQELDGYEDSVLFVDVDEWKEQNE